MAVETRMTNLLESGLKDWCSSYDHLVTSSDIQVKFIQLPSNKEDITFVRVFQSSMRIMSKHNNYVDYT